MGCEGYLQIYVFNEGEGSCVSFDAWGKLLLESVDPAKRLCTVGAYHLYLDGSNDGSVYSLRAYLFSSQ